MCCLLSLELMGPDFTCAIFKENLRLVSKAMQVPNFLNPLSSLNSYILLSIQLQLLLRKFSVGGGVSAGRTGV